MYSSMSFVIMKCLPNTHYITVLVVESYRGPPYPLACMCVCTVRLLIIGAVKDTTLHGKRLPIISYSNIRVWGLICLIPLLGPQLPLHACVLWKEYHF